jgi:hypothetical protein
MGVLLGANRVGDVSEKVLWFESLLKVMCVACEISSVIELTASSDVLRMGVVDFVIERRRLKRGSPSSAPVAMMKLRAQMSRDR